MRAALGPRRVLTALAVVVVGLLGVSGMAAAGSGVPYTDPNAVGYIGLCNQGGHQITSGNVDATPFAWRAVSSQAAPAPYNNADRTAILLAYQPQQGLASGEWSGDELTASARYTNPANPMAAATAGDDSLADFIDEFHPKWDGLLQLRMYLGTQNQEQYESHYPVLNIKVTGDTWSALGGGPVNCDSGSAVSLESVVLPATTAPSAKGAKGVKSPTGATVPGSNSHPGAATSGPHGASTGPASHPGGAPDGATGSGRHLSAAPADPARASSASPLIAVVVGVALVLGAAGYFIRRRRRRPSLSPSPSGTILSSSTKGQ
jgi:LPXTG-motif cell wall-anchored protein